MLMKLDSFLLLDPLLQEDMGSLYDSAVGDWRRQLVGSETHSISLYSLRPGTAVITHSSLQWRALTLSLLPIRTNLIKRKHLWVWKHFDATNFC